MQQTLDGSGIPVELAPGVTLEAPGLYGTAELQPGLVGGRSAAEPNATEGLREALENQEFLQQHAVSVEAVETGPPTDALRSATGAPGMTLRVPDIGDAQPQVLMMVDEAGLVTWHFPDPEPNGTLAFTVDRTVAIPGEGADAGERGLAAMIGHKLLTVFVVPIAEALIGAVGARLVEGYEERNRPQLVRWMTPEGYRKPGADRVTDWSLLGDGPVLFFVHGTASSSHGAFSGLPLETFAALHAAYGGRVIAFDHHTLSKNLTENVATLRELLPNERRIPVDVVTHSRGGLVTRAVADAMKDRTSPVEVRKVVYVATPNGGTVLADPDNTRAYLDRMSTMLNLLPDGPWSAVTDVMSALLTVVRAVVAGTVGALPGLQVMNPGNDVLDKLGFPGAYGATEYAIDVEFEPTGRLLRLVRGVDSVVDRVFGGTANDIVVPTTGVTRVEGREDFSVPADRHLPLGRSDDAWHCRLFRQPRVGAALTGWLRP